MINLKNGKEIIINLCDTFGQEKLGYYTKLFFKDCDCIVLGYDITKKESFQNIKDYWYEMCKEFTKTDLIYLVANKTDLYESKEVNEEEARNYVKENNMRFFPISYITLSGIKEFQFDLISKLLKK